MSAARHRLSAPSAAMGWFVPIAGLVVPLVIVTDVVPRGVADPSMAMVRCWWSTWIAGSVLIPGLHGCSVADRLGRRALLDPVAYLDASKTGGEPTNKRSIATTGADRPRSFRDDTPAFDKPITG